MRNEKSIDTSLCYSNILLVTKYDFIHQYLIVTMSLLKYMDYYYLIVCTVLSVIIFVIVIISVESVRYCYLYSRYMTLVVDVHAANMVNQLIF